MFENVRETLGKLLKGDWEGLEKQGLDEAIDYAEEHPDKSPLTAEELKDIRRKRNIAEREPEKETYTFEA